MDLKKRFKNMKEVYDIAENIVKENYYFGMKELSPDIKIPWEVIYDAKLEKRNLEKVANIFQREVLKKVKNILVFENPIISVRLRKDHLKIIYKK